MKRDIHTCARFFALAPVLLVALVTARPLEAQETPSAAEACEAFRLAAEEPSVPVAPLLDRPDVGRLALSRCRDTRGRPAARAAYGFALVAAGESDGVSELIAAADAGNADALYWLGLWYEDGLVLGGKAVLAPNLEAHRRMISAAAEQGHPNAQIYLGLAHQEGRLLEKDRDRARYWFERASAQEVPKGLYLLGSMLMTYPADSKDIERGRRMITRAAVLGDPHAQWVQAQLRIDDPNATEEAVESAKSTLRRLARSGMREAVITLGMALMEGTERIEANKSRAMAFFCSTRPIGKAVYEGLYSDVLDCKDADNQSKKKETLNNE